MRNGSVSMDTTSPGSGWDEQLPIFNLANEERGVPFDNKLLNCFLAPDKQEKVKIREDMLRVTNRGLYSPAQNIALTKWLAARDCT